jgi:hypothetical protein
MDWALGAAVPALAATGAVESALGATAPVLAATGAMGSAPVVPDMADRSRTVWPHAWQRSTWGSSVGEPCSGVKSHGWTSSSFRIHGAYAHPEIPSPPETIVRRRGTMCPAMRGLWILHEDRSLVSAENIGKDGWR